MSTADQFGQGRVLVEENRRLRIGTITGNEGRARRGRRTLEGFKVKKMSWWWIWESLGSQRRDVGRGASPGGELPSPQFLVFCMPVLLADMCFVLFWVTVMKINTWITSYRGSLFCQTLWKLLLPSCELPCLWIRVWNNWQIHTNGCTVSRWVCQEEAVGRKLLEFCSAHCARFAALPSFFASRAPGKDLNRWTGLLFSRRRAHL